MKKVYAIIGMAGLLLAPSLYATMDVTLYNDTSSYSHNNGGEFRAYGDAGLNAVVDWNAYLSGVTTGGTGNQPYFQTFCTELQEDFYPGHSYLVSTLGYNALNNGGIAAPPVPITMGVAYLYSQFAKGSLVGYDYTYGGGRSSTAGDLQNAIWALLSEGGSLASWVNTDLLNSGIQGSWYAPANGAYNVADMTLDKAGLAQDQLVILSDPQHQLTPVPEPATIISGALLLLPFGASTLRILRRRQAA